MNVDVAVIGAGPAGLKAAGVIAKHGGRVAVFDENSQCGGKLLGQLHEEPGNHHWWKGREIARSLIEEAESSGVQLFKETQIWGLEKGWTLHAADTFNRTNSIKEVSAKAVLLATGAVEKPLPLPGWTLPGVMTIGAAQVLANVYRVKPGERVIIVGLDVLSLTIARALDLAGVHVLGIVLPPKNNCNNKQKTEPKQVLKQLETMVHLAPKPLMRMGGRVLKLPLGIEMVSRLYPKRGMKVWGIPIQIKKTLVSIQGKKQVTGVEVAEIDSEGNIIPNTSKHLAVDAVCLSGGLMPLVELAAMAGCRFVRLEGLNGAVPLHSPYLETNVEHMYVAGNITGIEGAKVAIAQGELAGKTICWKLGLGSVTEADVKQSFEELQNVRAHMDIHFHSEIKRSREKLVQIWERESNNF